jgi:hypothetical protein
VSYFLGERQIHQSNLPERENVTLTVTYTIKLEIIDCLFKDSYNGWETLGTHGIA